MHPSIIFYTSKQNILLACFGFEGYIGGSWRTNSGENINMALVGMPKHQNENTSSGESQVST